MALYLQRSPAALGRALEMESKIDELQDLHTALIKNLLRLKAQVIRLERTVTRLSNDVNSVLVTTFPNDTIEQSELEEGEIRE